MPTPLRPFATLALRFAFASGVLLAASALQAQTAPSPGTRPADTLRADAAAAVLAPPPAHAPTFIVAPAAVPVLPARSVAELAGLLPGLRRDPVGPALTFRGVEGSTYVLDGQRMAGTPDLPAAAVAALGAWTGLMPARRGNALGAVVEVATRADAEALTGNAEALTGNAEALGSDGLDAYGYRLAAASFGAPLVPGRLGVFAAAEWRRAADADPRAGGYARVSDAVRADLAAAPTALFVRLPDGTPRLVPIPAGTPEGTPVSTLLAGLPAGTEAFGTQVRSRYVDPAAFERGAADNPAEALRLHGGAVATLGGLALRLDGQWTRDRARAFDPRVAVFDPTALARIEADAWRLGLQARRDFTGGSVRLRTSFEGTAYVRYDARFSSDVRDLLAYGDVNGPAGTLAQGAFEPTYRDTSFVLVGSAYDGLFPTAPNFAFAAPGSVVAGYAREGSARTLVGLDGTVAVGRHRIEAGLEAEARTLRAFRLDTPELLAQFADDPDDPYSPGPEFFTGVPITDYEDLTPVQLIRATYYGYTFNGLETQDELRTTFLEGSGYELPAHRPAYAAVYARDAFALGPLALDLGLRVEAYGSNALGLLDPFTFTPVIRAGDAVLTSPTSDYYQGPGFTPPDGIGDDYAVYVDGLGVVVGYRDLNGRFYDAEGATLSPSEIVSYLATRNGRTVQYGGALPELEEAETAFVVLPRIGAALGLAPGLEAFAFYQALAQAPPSALAFPDLSRLLNGPFFGTADLALASLRPERATEVGVGLRAHPAPGLRAEVVGYRRRYRDLVGRYLFSDGGFGGYTGWYNGHGGTVMGATATGEARVGGLEALVSVTAERVPTVLARRYQVATSNVTRSTGLVYSDPTFMHLGLTASASYGRALSAGPLGEARLGAVLRADRGAPHVAASEAEFYAGITRVVEASTFVQFDLRAEAGLRLGGADLAVAVWVENVLGRTNVIGVYPTTGLVDDPGLADPAILQDNVFGAEALAQYEALSRNPLHYGRPRQLRLGLVLRY